MMTLFLKKMSQCGRGGKGRKKEKGDEGEGKTQPPVHIDLGKH
jgi:hypothetical protein